MILCLIVFNKTINYFIFKMYIKSIVIDGFKSYGKRTEITNFDKSFNAITGLNGSGKSNILDAICFVLGISNLSYVRATSMQDFVYKQGQANINKATVSVTFDNTDERQCPPGYEDQREIIVTRQVVIGGKNKYQINGLNVQNNRVQDLFKSVQLNVNNPHFLIMQGRITKVLNMKPMEILSMVEEAAGTRLYKTKKEQSVKTLEKKDTKMQEIDRQLQEDLEPKIAKLRDERQQYQELLKLNREMEQLSRINLAHKFFLAEKKNASIEKELQDVNEQIAKSKEAIASGKKETAELEEAIRIAQERWEEEGGGHLKEAEKELSEAERHHAQLVAKDKSGVDAIKAEQRRRQQVAKSMATDQKLLQKKQEVLEKGREEYTTMEEETQKLQTALEAARKRHQAASQGLFVDEQGNASSLQQQLIEAQAAMISAQTESKTLAMKMEPLKSQLKAKNDQIKKIGGNLGNEQAQLNNLEKVIAKLQGELEKLQPSVTQQQELTTRNATLTKTARGLDQQINTQLNAFPRAKFDFTDPEPNFDRSLVKGMVCRLFKIRDSKFANALENAAGAKLYNVVTRNELVAKKLIQNNCVAQRITYMPLNKLSSRPLNPRQVAAAKSMFGDDNVWYALDLVEYEPELQPVMESVFGSTLICTDMKIAKVLPYENQVRARCVTLDGDVVETTGTLSGGSVSRSKPLLAVLAGLQKQQEELVSAQREVQDIQGRLVNLDQCAECHQTLQADFDTKSHQATLLRTSIEQSAHGRLELEIKTLENEISGNTERLKELQDVERKTTQQHKELETKVKQSKSLAEKEKKAADKEMKELQAELDKRQQKWEECEQKFKTLEMEIEEMNNAIEAAQTDLSNSEEMIKKMEEDLNTGKEEMESVMRILNLRYVGKVSRVRNAETSHAVSMAPLSKMSLESLGSLVDEIATDLAVIADV
ncbi:hypothetical protein B566_EDAN005484 [Ephemera danica]|nr:hypothetical protein B566_EDAN005484 [Ephemera danica]